MSACVKSYVKKSAIPQMFGFLTSVLKLSQLECMESLRVQRHFRIPLAWGLLVFNGVIRVRRMSTSNLLEMFLCDKSRVSQT